jgi:hypothetical protein
MAKGTYALGSGRSLLIPAIQACALALAFAFRQVGSASGESNTSTLNQGASREFSFSLLWPGGLVAVARGVAPSAR